MKKFLSVILTVLTVVAALTATSCEYNIRSHDVGGSENLRFLVGSEAAEAVPGVGEDEAVCCITAENSGDVKIPVTHDGKQVAAVTCDPDVDDDITSVEIPDGVRYIYRCFNGTEDRTIKKLSSLKLPTSLVKISDSFNYCPQAALVDEFFSSENYDKCFNNCDNLFDNLLAGDARLVHGAESIIDSFNNNDTAAAIDISEKIGTIRSSFLNWKKLDNIDFNWKVDSVEASFIGCSALRDIWFYRAVGTIDSSFCDCEALETVHYKEGADKVTSSFADCPWLLEDYNGEKIPPESEDPRTYEEKWVTTMYEDAINKLVADGVIPELNEDGNPQFETALRDEKRCDSLVFLDKQAGKRLTAKPKVDFDKVLFIEKICSYIIDDKMILKLAPYMPEGAKKLQNSSALAQSHRDCRYLFYLAYFESNKIEDYYISGERTDMTTLVFIIDAASREIIHVEIIGTDIPPDVTTMGTGQIGDMLTEDGENYMLSLLK